MNAGAWLTLVDVTVMMSVASVACAGLVGDPDDGRSWSRHSELSGVPPSAPAEETVSQEGPETFVNVRMSAGLPSVAASWPVTGGLRSLGNAVVRAENTGARFAVSVGDRGDGDGDRGEWRVRRFRRWL